MATKETKKAALKLYKQLLRSSTQFITYNYRAYAWRHTKYSFRQNRALESNEEIAASLEKGQRELESLRRQVIVDRLYSTNNSIHNLPVFQETVSHTKAA
mmetsp:Transcript_28042/g.44481  ORF Transcript_28042/g.44481 Transcript_28042/m.44481 type:complete len:100 (+) Transcript_28042:1-300(+)